MLVISITILYRKNIWRWRQWRKRDDKPPRGKKYLLKYPPNCKRHPSANNISDAGTVHVFVYECTLHQPKFALPHRAAYFGKI